MTWNELYATALVELIRKSGVREWQDIDTRAAIIAAAVDFANIGTEEFEMATSKLLIPEMDGTPKQIWFGASGGTFTAANDLRDTVSGNRTAGILTLNALANSSSESTGARQSDKVDLGAVRSPIYDVFGALSWQATPTSGNVLEVWWSSSPSATAATANCGNATGVDAAYSGYSSNITASLRHCQYVGEFVVGVAGTGITQGRIGMLAPRHRYGSLIIWNKGGSALTASANELHIVLNPRFLQGQAA